jgi:hypothetical protein
MAFQVSNPAALMAPGIEGGWTGANPHFTLTNPNEGDWKVGATGLFIGRFAWGDSLTGLMTSAHPGTADVRIGFIHRDQQTYITGLLNASSLAMTAGQMVDALEDGPVWGRFAAGVTKTGLKVYASYADGSLRAAVTASPATATGVTATTVSGSPNITAVAGGTLVPGQLVTGSGIPALAYVVSVSGTTAVLSANATASASGVALTQTTDFETNWATRSICLSGEIAKISVRG